MWRFLKCILSHPIQATCFGYNFGAQVFLLCLKKVLLPFWPNYQSFRIQLQRAYWSSSSHSFPDLIHRLPVTYCPESRARKVGSESWTAYVIPGTRDLNETSDGRRCVIIYAHGGGYARGEARMYLRYMNRWIKEASQAGLCLTFLSVEYRT
jgi:acetyl esterase/lipase